MGLIEELIPSDYLEAYRRHPPPPPVVRGPLPDLVTHHYSSGGCFILAAALHQATGSPIELYYHAGLPTHAYITDETRSLDVRGPRPIEAARAGAERLRRVPLGALAALLRSLPHGEDRVTDLKRPHSQVAADRRGT